MGMKTALMTIQKKSYIVNHQLYPRFALANSGLRWTNTEIEEEVIAVITNKENSYISITPMKVVSTTEMVKTFTVAIGIHQHLRSTCQISMEEKSVDYVVVKISERQLGLCVKMVDVRRDSRLVL